MSALHGWPLGLILLMTLSCATRASSQAPSPERSERSSLEAAAQAMTGSFSSAAQAKADPSYFDIRLEMVPIWGERDDGPWLYVEQAAAEALDKPYRQRVYRLIALQDGQLESRVYTLPDDPLVWAGAWRSPKRFEALDPAQLKLRQGCAVILSPGSDSTLYAGSTRDKDCLSDLRGATYATSEVTITAQGISSWDRGFNAADEQVWGATLGPYVFIRQ